MSNRFLKKTLILLLCCSSYVVAITQSKQVDSLAALLKDEKTDTGKVKLLNALSKQYFQDQKYDSAKKYSADALALAEKNDFEEGIKTSISNLGDDYHRIGNMYHGLGNYPEALKNYLESMKWREKINDKPKIAKLYGNIGLIYWAQYNYEEALKNHNTSFKIFEELGDKNGMAGTYNNIGLVYETEGNHHEALKNYFAAIKLYEEIGDKESMVNRYFNIGFLYDDQGKYDEALKNHLAALKISTEIKDSSGTAASYSNIGDIYLHKALKQSDLKEKQSLLDKSMSSYTTASEMYKKLGEKEGLAVVYSGIGNVFFQTKNYAEAKQFLTNSISISKEEGMVDNNRTNYQLLTSVDSATNDWKNAFIDHNLFILYRDSLLNQENTRKTLRIQMQYEFGKKEDSLKFQEDLTNANLKRQKRTKNYLIIGFALFAGLSFFIYQNYRTRQKLKLLKLRNRIASDLHDDVGSTLSSISIFSQMAQEQSKETIPLLESIGESSRKMLDAMSDIVWTLNPENDQFEKIIMRMKSFAYELLGARNIDFEFLADENVQRLKLPMEVRKSFYLIFKEAINNMVKYSQANKAKFEVKEEETKLTMTIKDNGIGFDSNKISEGNGLKNMKKRASEIGADLVIDSRSGNGTMVQLKIAI